MSDNINKYSCEVSACVVYENTQMWSKRFELRADAEKFLHHVKEKYDDYWDTVHHHQYHPIFGYGDTYFVLRDIKVVSTESLDNLEFIGGSSDIVSTY